MDREKIFNFLLGSGFIIIIIIAILIGNNASFKKNNIEIKEQENKSDITIKEDENKNKPEIKEDEKLNAKDEEIIKKKVAYLTFDDGPSPTVTPKVLDVLKAYDVKATFFILGKNVEEYPKIFKKTIEEGHAIANHSYSHNYKKIYSSLEAFREEVEKTNQIIYKFSDNKINTKVFRFPGGSFNRKTDYKTMVKNSGMEYYDWNCLNGDAEGNNISKDKLIQRFKESYNNQDKLIILMHDTNTKISTVDSLPEIIEYLKKQGYEFGVLK